MIKDGITIVIPAYNEEKYLPALLSSIQVSASYFHSLIQEEIEIIVIDNNSTDRTAEVARSFGARVI